MNEIEKIYKNAKIEPIAEYCKHQCNNEFDDDACIGCKHIEKVEYPPFTAEKQIGLIKFLGKTRDFHTCGRYCTALNSECDSIESLQDKFEESLAGLINELWQDLTEEEKQQIKEILE